MSEHPEYLIESFEDFDKVPEDRLETCLADFVEYLRMGRMIRSAFNSEAVSLVPRFIWVDDGIAGVSSIRFVDRDGNRIDLDDNVAGDKP